MAAPTGVVSTGTTMSGMDELLRNVFLLFVYVFVCLYLECLCSWKGSSN